MGFLGLTLDAMRRPGLAGLGPVVCRGIASSTTPLPPLARPPPQVDHQLMDPHQLPDRQGGRTAALVVI